MIYVCSLYELPAHAERLAPSHLVSLLSPNELPPTPPGVAADRHHRVGIHDINEPLDGHILPDEDHVAELIDFLRAWSPDEGPLLIHCFAGVSRSMAAALIALVLDAPGKEAAAAQHMRRAAPHAQPNKRIVALADELLDRDGRLVAAREAMGPGDISQWGPLVRLDLLR